MLRLIIIILISQFIISCTGIVGGQYEENLEKFDKIYGYCDNPHRGMLKKSVEYTTCKRKEMAAGADGIIDDDAGIPFEDLFNKNKQEGGSVIMANVNKDLWIGSLETLNDYSLKIADSMGGYIETDWIYTSGVGNQRCLIKIQVLSSELITTGVTSSFLCENKTDDIWLSDNKNYPDEEKKIILKILEIAGSLSSSTS